MNTHEIGLFFDRKYIFDPTNFSQKISQKFSELGKPKILPVIENKNTPVIIYDENASLKLFVTLDNLMLHVLLDEKDNEKEYFKIIFSILKEFNINVSRIGLINTVTLGEKEKSLFVNNAFDSKEIINSKEFQLSYFQNIIYNDISLNCWKRYITNNDKFITIFDINTLKNDNHNIDLKFTIDFIKFATNYMSNNHIVKLY